ncbi:polyhydroxyalkanoate synthesis repressor PhaR [Amylibacter sp. IMCC11727]|uniref:polyhydroxyalkanoate synthesis repressor PhaR n=1 Tax=Amylibacter sp. IMCC11727 TaxID=3039851 RepID=UPI00244DDAB5|nr:polyhydroxyalkanoate synthesis repressor PhaR [Amylibacter sp. IMCC11727]WGI22781.1 polyhydroxyalkanoate synthesis repressor PhaR [Amylibacter sp. IMCC11727]
MADPILINRYASRRLYNTQTSEYVTLDEISELIKQGNDVEIRDRKTGEDLTRQFLLQIITEQESKGENVLPVNVLTGLVRSYSTAAQGMLPDFLSQSYEMFTQQQQSMMEKIPGMGAAGNWQKQQADMMQSMMAAWMPQMQNTGAATPKEEPESTPESEELSAVKQQLAELMKKVDGL